MNLTNLLVDGFAGGGGASTGIEMATGRQVDIAINHDPDAILMHKTNHPSTMHLQESIWDVKPLEVTKGRHVGLLWMSPDCKHFSKAKGGKPKDNNIRALPMAIVMWAKEVRPDVIMAENVEEIQTWGPLDDNGYPIPEKKGETFIFFIESLRKLGYVVEWKELVAADYGAPTIRKRWYMIARCDGKPIVWPLPTHSKTGAKGLKKWVPVSTCIDFSDLGNSIFGRKKPLAENTMNRIARGMDKFVFNNPEPFIMQTGQTGFTNDRNKTIDEPLTTIVSKQEHCLVTPFLAQYHSYSTDSVRGQSINDPIMTIDASPRYALATGFLTKYFVGTYKGAGSALDSPIHTITTKDRNAVIATFLTKFYKTGIGQSMEEPLHTITTSPGHFGQVSVLAAEKDSLLSSVDIPDKDHENFIQKCNWVASFIMEYYGQGTGQVLTEPMHTIVTKDRFALVTIYGVDYVICDILLRMLKPRELFKAQGFPDDYIINRDYTGKAYPVSKQVARCGNSVVPIMAASLVSANCRDLKVGDRIPNMSIDDTRQQLRFA